MPTRRRISRRQQTRALVSRPPAFTRALLVSTVLCTLALLMPSTTAVVTATAAIDLCDGIHIDSQEPLGCTEKVTVELTIDGRQVTGTAEDWRTTISMAQDHTLFAAVSGDGAVANATFTPLSFDALLSPTQQRYALRYAREFSRTLWAEPVSSGALPGCGVLEDTCGSYTRVDGTFVAESNGLCCECSQCLVNGCDGLQMEDLCVGSSFGTLCLRSSNDTYSGYELGPLSLWYTLNLSVTGAGLRSPSGKDGVTFDVNTNAVRAREDFVAGDARTPGTGTLAVVGAAAGKSTAIQADFSQYVLFVPSAPVNSTLVAAGAAEWMLLAPSLVTLDGSQCGRVGVSQEAWETVGQAQCMEAKGSCYGRQLGELRAEDAVRMQNGQSAKFMASSLGDFERTQLQFSPGTTAVDSLMGASAATPTLTLRIVLPAEVVHPVLVPADGVITSAAARETAYGAVANAITVTVRNTDVLGSRFSVALSDCTPGVTSLSGTAVFALVAGGTQSVSFTVAQPVTATARSLSCTATLRDAGNSTLVTRTVAWLTTGEPPSPGGGSDSGSGTTSGGSTSAGAVQEERCRVCGLADFRCIWPNACLWQTFVWAALSEVLCGILWGVARWWDIRALAQWTPATQPAEVLPKKRSSHGSATPASRTF